MTAGSGTVEKALTLLRLFSEESPSIGLSRLSRLSGINKATTLRYLLALKSAGFVEQDESTSKYYLGPAFSKYARIREATDPFYRIAERVLSQLSSLTNETAHVSKLTQNILETVALVESTRSARVILPFAEKLPLHATASGLALLAWSSSKLVNDVISAGLTKYTDYTITSKELLQDTLKQVRTNGYSRGFQGYELDVVGIATPYFDANAIACGAVAVAFPTSRSSSDIEETVAQAVLAASRQLTEARGGIEPRGFGNQIFTPTA